MTSRVIAGVVAGVLAIVGTVLLLSYIRGIETQVAEGERVVDVLVVQDHVPAGTPVDELGDRVRIEQIEARHLVQGALTDLSEVAAWIVVADLIPGEQLLSARLEPATEVVDDGEVEVPAGLHQVTLSLEPHRVLGGLLSPGDTVGVFISLASTPDDDIGDTTHLVLHKVLVTRLQLDRADATADRDTASIAPSARIFVTLAATAGEVERIVFGAEHGTVWLSLEPLDASERGTEVRERSSIFG